MLDDPLAGRGLRAPERSRLLVATEDGIFLWPGVALVERRGNGFFAADPRAVNSAIGCLFGPSAIDLPIEAVLERARDELRCGRVAAVQTTLDRIPLPPVSPNGSALIRAIAERQDLLLPEFFETTQPSGTAWTAHDIGSIAKLYDFVQSRAVALANVFNPGSAWKPEKHPRWPAGETDGGEFRPSDGSEDGLLIPIADKGPPQPWHNNPPERIGDPPEIPKANPATKAAKFLAIRTVIYWLGAALKVGSKVSPAVIKSVHCRADGTVALALCKRLFGQAEDAGRIAGGSKLTQRRLRYPSHRRENAS